MYWGVSSDAQLINFAVSKQNIPFNPTQLIVSPDEV